MEKERRIKTLSLVALIVAVLGLTVAFAALSQTLTINGTATVDAASWDVHFENLKQEYVTGTAEVISEPNISSDGKGIENLQVSLKKPGDYVRYSYNAVNDGTIDAELTSFLNNGFSEEDFDAIEEGSEEWQFRYTEILRAMYPKADWDGDGITTDEERIKAANDIYYVTSFNLSGVESRETLSAGDKKYVYIEICWSGDSNELPKGEVVMNIDLQFIFSQK